MGEKGKCKNLRVLKRCRTFFPGILLTIFNENPASCGGHKADGVSKGEKRKLSLLVEHRDSNPVFDIT